MIIIFVLICVILMIQASKSFLKTACNTRMMYTNFNQKRFKISMRVDKDISIPMDKIEFKFARSSGPGGQNVNKLNTKAEVRFKVSSADWIPDETKERLIEYQASKINKNGELIIVCQEFRTQAKNKQECISKLKEIIADASIKPKDREMWTGIGEKGKKERRKTKSFKSEKKASRRPPSF